MTIVRLVGRDGMLYGQWVDRVWLAVSEYWSELGDAQRKLGIPCDAALLGKIGFEIGDEIEEDNPVLKDGLESVYSALKAIEGLGQLLEVLPNRFRLVDSAMHRLGQSLAPLHDIYRSQPLPPDALAFLGQLAKASVSLRPLRAAKAGASSPVEGEKHFTYPFVHPQDAAEVFGQLGWTWIGPIDQGALDIIHTLKAVGMVETIYRDGKLMCAPTFKGLLRVEQANGY